MVVPVGRVNQDWPVVVHEVAFAADPFDPNPLWTDITDRVESWSGGRGRQYELARTEAGEQGLLLDNRDGALDPSNAASPYAPGVEPVRPTRTRATWNGVTYDLFTGYIERWPQAWAMHGTYGRSDVTAVDAFALLARVDLPSVYAAEILADSPAYYFPLGEASGSERAGSMVPAPSGYLRSSKYGPGTVTFGGDAPLVGDPATSAGFDSLTAGLISATGSLTVIELASNGASVVPANQAFSVESWFRVADLPPGPFDTYAITAQHNYDRSRFAWLFIAQDGRLRFDAGGAAYTRVTSPGVVADGLWHHAVATLDADLRTLRLYLDGRLVSTTVAPAPLRLDGLIFNQVGGVIAQLSDLNVGWALRGSVGHVAQYPGALSSERIAAHFRAGSDGWAGEDSGARFLRLLRYAHWTGPTSVQTGKSLLGPATGLGATTQALQDVASWEAGNTFVTGSGAVAFRSRADRQLKTTPLYTFGEQELPYDGDIAFDFDPTYVYNDITVKRTDGVVARTTDEDSIRRYGRRTFSIELRTASDLEATDADNYLLSRYSRPHLRLPKLTITPSANPALWPAALGAGIGDRVRVLRRPPKAPTISTDCFIEHVSHSVSSGAWKTTFLLSPADPEAVWILEDPVYGVLESTARLSY